MFNVVHLSVDDVRTGMLFQISDALHEAFTSSAKAIINEGKRGGDVDQMIIYVDNSSTNLADFLERDDSNLMEILYLNDSALNVIREYGVDLQVVDKIENPSSTAILFAYQPRYINLH
jgi:hypothetical protein